MSNTPLDRLRYHVTGAIERGEAEAIVERRAVSVGDRVKHSDHVIRPKRDYMLGCSGSRKAETTRWLNEAKAERGTVTELIPQKNDLAAAIQVQWDNGIISRCLPYMVETV